MIDHEVDGLSSSPFPKRRDFDSFSSGIQKSGRHDVK